MYAVLCPCFVCVGGGLNRNKINEMIKKTGYTIDLNPDLLEVIMAQGMSSVMQHEDDPLYILLSHSVCRSQRLDRSVQGTKIGHLHLSVSSQELC